MALMQTKLSKGVLKSKVPRDCAVKAEHSNLSNTSCFQDDWGQGNQGYFSQSKILLKQFLREVVLFLLRFFYFYLFIFVAAMLAQCLLSSTCSMQFHACSAVATP